MSWQHYDLKEKWTHAAALVFGRRGALGSGHMELADVYSGYYENDHVEFLISIWPLAGGDGDGANRRGLFGSGDFYFHLADGQDANGKYLPAPLKLLRTQQAGLGRHFAEWGPEDAAWEDDEERWWVVSAPERCAAVYFGLALKPGQVPSELGELESVRATDPSTGKPHPRSVVGVRLADTGTSGIAPFDPDDARVAAARRALAKLLPKLHKSAGFLVVPAEPRTEVQVLEPEPAPRPEREGDEGRWLSRLETLFGPLESDDDTYVSGRLRGVVIRLPEPHHDALDAWASAPRWFAFNDRAAEYRRWRGEGVSLLELDIETIDEGLETRWVALMEMEERSLLLVLDDADPAALRDALGIAKDAECERGEATLGHG